MPSGCGSVASGPSGETLIDAGAKVTGSDRGRSADGRSRDGRLGQHFGCHRPGVGAMAVHGRGAVLATGARLPRRQYAGWNLSSEGISPWARDRRGRWPASSRSYGARLSRNRPRPPCCSETPNHRRRGRGKGRQGDRIAAEGLTFLYAPTQSLAGRSRSSRGAGSRLAQGQRPGISAGKTSSTASARRRCRRRIPIS